MATEVSAREILRLREFTQRIHPAATGTVAETVRHLLALQAQDFTNALWAAGIRTQRANRTDVLAALQAGEIVRTLPMRGTLHFIAAEDLRWMLEVTAARTLQSARKRFDDLGLDPSTLVRSESIALQGLAGKPATRDEFMTQLRENGIEPDGQRGYHVIFYLAHRGIICWGPPAATQQALVLVDEWIPEQQRPDRDAALIQFAQRYFASHGPATERDFAWWTKLTLADIREAMAGCDGALTELTHNGTSYWIATSELEAATGTKAPGSVHLLPGFDEFLLGYQDRTLPLAPEHSQQIVPGNNGIFLPTIVSSGRVVGTWRRNAKSKTAAITAEHFETANAAARAGFTKAAAAYARFADS